MTKEAIGLTGAQIQLSDADPVLLAEGMQLIREEKAMSFREAMRHHWRGCLWSITLSLALVMDGKLHWIHRQQMLTLKGTTVRLSTRSMPSPPSCSALARTSRTVQA